jgi:hypothetical protein
MATIKVKKAGKVSKKPVKAKKTDLVARRN